MGTPDRDPAAMNTESDATTAKPARDYLIRSEERLNVGTRRVPSGRVRLEKYVVTETRTISVEVSREEVRLVHLDLADLDGGGAEAASDAEERWLVVSEEQVVINKVVVPLERVRLQRNTVVVDRDVTEQVRRERIDVEPLTNSERADLADTNIPNPNQGVLK